MRILIELAAEAIEAFAVAIIVIAILNGKSKTLMNSTRLRLEKHCYWASKFLWLPTLSRPWHSNRIFKMS